MNHEFSSGTPSKADAGATSTKVMNKKGERVYAVFINDSNETIYLSLGSAAVMNSGIRLNANGGVYEINNFRPFKGDVYAICSSGSKNLAMFEA